MVNDNMGPGGSVGTGNVDYRSMGGTVGNPLPDLTPNMFGDNDARIAGKRSFCFNRTGSAGYYVTHVIVER